MLKMYYLHRAFSVVHFNTKLQQHGARDVSTNHEFQAFQGRIKIWTNQQQQVQISTKNAYSAVRDILIYSTA